MYCSMSVKELQQENYRMDYFDTLPNELQTYILSFMSVKEAVQTCILSRKWKNAWAFLPVLRFDIAEWVDLTLSGWFDSEEQLRLGEAEFEIFLHDLLQNREAESQLDKFTYENLFENLRSEEISLGFLEELVPHYPRMICIDIARQSLSRLYIPDAILSCTSIEQFELSVNIEDNQLTLYTIKPEACNLPALRTLILAGIALDDGFIQNVCSERSVLQTVVLTLCHLDISEISSKGLKKLTIDKCSQSKAMTISCPNLCTLVIESYGESSGFVLCNLQSLEYAKIYIDLDKIRGVPNLLKSLSNVNHLKFGLWGTQLKMKLKEDISECGTFINLKDLDINYRGMIDDIDFVVDILNHSPSLEVLSLQPYQLQKGEPKEELSQEGLKNRRDVLFKGEYLKMVRIVKPKRQPDMEVWRLMNKLRDHIKIIGQVHIIG